MTTCTGCGKQLDAQDETCAACGLTQPEVVATPEEVADSAAPSPPDEEPSLLGTILGVLGWLVLFFIAIVVVITFYAAVAAGSLAMGVPLNGGIAIATVLLLGIVGLGVWLYLRRKRRSA
jgi:hypothetical protein